ncbi:MAG: hypothetical protein Q9163_002913 [Psora crenata]
MKRKFPDSERALNDNTVVKVKLEENGTDYSQDAKKRLNTASRTGTACDRCRLRKMRCDDQPDGCSSCRQAQTECKTTDRITGKATVRGYVESLECRIGEMEGYIRDLQAQVRSLGGIVQGETSAQSTVSAQYPQYQSDNNPREDQRTLVGNGMIQDQSRHDSGSKTFKNPARAPAGSNGLSNGRIRLPTFRGGLSGNNYLGISSGNSLLSSTRGTSMNVLGMEIDLADYMSDDLDEPDPSQEPVYNKSYRAFVQTAFGVSPKLNKVQLPPRSEGMNYADVYFRITNPYAPVIHKPTFIKLLSHVYDDPTFQPSVAETVLVHAMFAILYCQFASRAAHNTEQRAKLSQSSNLHYHYALGFFAQLMASHTLADVQALALLCIHVRNLPKPGASWMLTSITLNLAIELGLHRSAKNWAPATSKRSVLEIEMRKRVFWSLVWIHVLVGGSLGRPMALGAQDWDVEVPEMVDDELLSEKGMDMSKPGRCNFLVGIQNFKVVPIYIDLYNDIYAVRRSPENYEETVRGLESRVQEFVDQWPRELVAESAFENELGRVHLQYLHLWKLHIRLLLRHPSLSLSSSPQINAENLTACMEASKEMLQHVKLIQKFKSLDGTWQTGALFVLAIATTLYGHWERREQITKKDLNLLKDDMRDWLSIINDMATMLGMHHIRDDHFLLADSQPGSGRRLQDKVRATVNNCLTLLSKHLINKTAPPPYRHQNANSPPTQVIRREEPLINNDYNRSSPYHTYNTPDSVARSNASKPKGSYLNSAADMPQAHLTTYNNTQQYTYEAPYSSTSDYSSTLQQPTPLPATATAGTPYMTSYPSAPYQPSYTQSSAYTTSPADICHPPGSPTSWRQFTGNMVPNLDTAPGEYMSSASALMQLGGGQGEIIDTPEMGRVDIADEAAQMWPMMVFDRSAGVG